MAVVAGPTEVLGHPFRVVTEVPVERRVGGHTVYAFGTKWLYSELEVIPGEPVEAVVVWDPGWLRTGTGEGAKHEIHRIWELAQEWDAPVIGLFSDWFAAWKTETGIVGTLAATMYCDALIVDPAGASALRHSVHPLSVTDPADHRYRPIQEMSGFLTYGRLPRVGGGIHVEMKPIHEREVDVAMVSTLHPQHVVLRPYYVDALREICDRLGLRFEWTDKASASEMEELYLNSKVVANVSLGTQHNCRVPEALACGAMLLTDGWNIGMKDVPCARFLDPWEMEVLLNDLLQMGPDQQQRQQDLGLLWATRNSPERTWKRVFDAATILAPMTVKARRARQRMAEERHAAN